jgi:hypothetical protein
MSYLRYVCLFAYSGVQLNPYCVFCLSSSVYHILPVSLDCPLRAIGQTTIYKTLHGKLMIEQHE